VSFALDRGQTGLLVLSLRGENDTYIAPSLRAELELVREEPLPLVIDLGEATFLDSTVVGLLLAAFREAEQRSRVFLLYTPESTGPAVRRLFQLTRLDSLLPLVPDWAAVQGIVQGTADRLR
jgi:anti-anti-sigma factor